MGISNFTDGFDRDAVVYITKRGYPVSEALERPG